MNRISLDGEWSLKYFRDEGGAPMAPAEVRKLGAPSIQAQVPGNVELDLQRAGVLPEPFQGTNMYLLRPYEFNEYWYRRTFELPGGHEGARWDLVFAGLDTVATIWVNDVEVGHADNMLIPHRFDVTAAVRPGAANEICVRIGSPLREAERYHYDASVLSWERREEGVYLRKAPHMWGWDIMPRVVSAGIWRQVWIEQRAGDAIEQLYFWTAEASADAATLGVRFKVRSERFGPEAALCLRFKGVCQESTFEHCWPLEFIAGGTTIAVNQPRLWWPKGYGQPDLYTVTVQLCDGEAVLAERRERIGIRRVRVERSEKAGAIWALGPEPGERARFDRAPEADARFLFYVNDTPILVKGSNWVPLDAFHSRDAGRYEAAVALFADLGCNMIRCWGGNVYEDHRFFDLCDELGILVWQDFAFACCRYPQDEAFLARVRAEAEAIVEALRNHASLALWSGDNEIDYTYANDGISRTHNRISREVLPQVVHRCDPYRHYLQSSPLIPEDPGAGMPEQHLWGPRNYYKSAFYTLHNAHFIGEMGYHGCPNVSSVKRFITPERLWPWENNEEWRLHNTYHWRHDKIDRDRIRLMINQVIEVFGAAPSSLEELALASQIVQAEAKKFFIESTRLRKWRTSGVLWWNVLDGWPQFSDAIVDYYFGKKLAYHYIRRVQHPVCAIIGECGSEKYRPLVIANDSRDPADVAYRVWCAESNEVLAEGHFRSPANENWQVARLRTYASRQRLLLIEWCIGEARYGNHYLEGHPPHSLERYRGWLPRIAALAQPFDAEAVAR